MRFLVAYNKMGFDLDMFLVLKLMTSSILRVWSNFGVGSRSNLIIMQCKSTVQNFMLVSQNARLCRHSSPLSPLPPLYQYYYRLIIDRLTLESVFQKRLLLSTIRTVNDYKNSQRNHLRFVLKRNGMWISYAFISIRVDVLEKKSVKKQTKKTSVPVTA